MLIQFKNVDRWLVATPEFSRLDAMVAPEFAAAMVERCRGSREVVLDLARINFIDSRGLSALVSVFKVLGADGVLKLANVQDQVDILLNLTRLKTIFPTFGSVEEAVQP